MRRADYSDPATLPEALAGVDVLLLVSGSEVGQRVAQHTAVIEAAKAAGVQRVAYTSIANADHSANPLQPEHKATEDVLRASGLPFTIFRNNWYLENYTGQVPQYLATGEVLGIDGDARIGAATRADMAAATTAALLDEGTAGATFELSGPPITLAGLAEAVTDVTGTKVAYRDVTPEELTAILRGTGTGRRNGRVRGRAGGVGGAGRSRRARRRPRAPARPPGHHPRRRPARRPPLTPASGGGGAPAAPLRLDQPPLPLPRVQLRARTTARTPIQANTSSRIPPRVTAVPAATAENTASPRVGGSMPTRPLPLTSTRTGVPAIRFPVTGTWPTCGRPVWST